MTAIRLPLNVGIACALAAMGLSCGSEYSDERCKDILVQVRAALKDNVEKGILVRDAVPCGEQGVANRPDSFDARVPPEDVEYLRGAFQHACQEYLENCS